MSTRAVVTFENAEGTEKYHVYTHHDGYAEGTADKFADALNFAWPLPRYEAADFAAAFVAGSKPLKGGSIYFTTGKDAHGDLEYWYRVTQAPNGQLIVEAYQIVWGKLTGHSYGIQSYARFFYGRMKDFVATYGSQYAKSVWDANVQSDNPIAA